MEFTKHAFEVWEEVPIAIVTGNPGPLSGHPVRCIEKPIPLAELANCLQEILQK